LQQAATVQASPDGSYEMFDYVVSLREGIMDAWGGIIGAMKSSDQSEFHMEFLPFLLLMTSQAHSSSHMSNKSSIFLTLSGLTQIGVKVC
jgi:importin subunit beta-1